MELLLNLNTSHVLPGMVIFATIENLSVWFSFMPSFKLVICFIFYVHFGHYVVKFCCSRFSVEMSALTQPQVCQSWLSIARIYQHQIKTSIPFYCSILYPFWWACIYSRSITISTGSKAKNKPFDKRFGKSKTKTATLKGNKNSIRSSHNKMILFVP